MNAVSVALCRSASGPSTGNSLFQTYFPFHISFVRSYFFAFFSLYLFSFSFCSAFSFYFFSSTSSSLLLLFFFSGICEIFTKTTLSVSNAVALVAAAVVGLFG